MRGFALLPLDLRHAVAARKSRLKPRLSQNLLTFWVSVQRLVVGGFGKKAVNLGEQKFVVRWGLGS